MQIGFNRRRSLRNSTFIWGLAVSVFSGSGAFAVEPISISSQTELEAIQDNLSGSYILTADIPVSTMESITNIGANPFTGTLNGSGFTISNLTKPLFNSLSSATISNLQLSGNVELSYYCGGMTCLQDEVGILARFTSNADLDAITVTGSVSGKDYVGGIAGWATGGTITNSHSNVTVIGEDNVGGIVGRGIDLSLNTSYSEGDIEGTGSSVGGLVGLFQGNSSSLSNSFAMGDVQGYSDVGGVVGRIIHSIEVNNVASTGDIEGVEIVGGVVGSADLCDPPTCASSGTLANISAYGSVLASDNRAGSLVGVLWSGVVNNYRAIATVVDIDPNNDLDLSDTFSGAGNDRLFACDCSGAASPTYGAILSGSTFNANDFISSMGGGTSGSNSSPTRNEKADGVIREGIETRPLEKIKKTIGFKNDTLLPKSAEISFFGSREEIDIAKVKSVEISPQENVKVSTKAGEALQISLKSESKESLELWVKSPGGKWLLAGVITFDKDGKAILPPLQFKNAGDYTLVLNKPTAGSAKGSEPLNQSGSLLVEVS